MVAQAELHNIKKQNKHKRGFKKTKMLWKMINTSCVIHFEDKVKVGSKERIFTSTRFEKFSLCREQWLSLSWQWLQIRFCTLSVARKSLGRIPVGTNGVTKLSEHNSKYHIACYQLFTNVSNFERALQQQDLATEEGGGGDDDRKNITQAQCSSTTESRRSSTRIALSAITQLEDSPSSSGQVLPRICIICKRAGPIYVTDNKVGSLNMCI